jgi:hypothetical protein
MCHDCVLRKHAATQSRSGLTHVYTHIMEPEHMRRLGRYFAWCKEEGEADDISWESDCSDPFLDKMDGTDN